MKRKRYLAAMTMLAVGVCFFNGCASRNIDSSQSDSTVRADDTVSEESVSAGSRNDTPEEAVSSGSRNDTPEESAAATLSTSGPTAGTVVTENTVGSIDGCDFELWKDQGDTTMTLKGGGNFTCEWSNINSALFRIGKKFDATKPWQELGTITVDYGADFKPNGNAYLCVYGWTKDPLVEYYVVESWGTWRPPGASSKGTITVDGEEYQVYETTRENQPSIEGTQTFQQYWSVRKHKNIKGTGKVTVSDHFQAWEDMGMKLGNLYETAFTVEGYQSAGSAEVYQNVVTVE